MVIYGGERSAGPVCGELGPLGRRSRAFFASAGASLLPQSGQVSKAAAAAPSISKVVPCRSTVTSVRTVQLVALADAPERKELARWLSH